MTGGLVDAALGLLVLIVANSVLDPAPLTAATVWIGALAASWFATARPVRAAALGAVPGMLAGICFHLYSHLAGHSTEPAEGIVLHLLSDAGIGLLVGSLALLASRARLLLRERRRRQ